MTYHEVIVKTLSEMDRSERFIHFERFVRGLFDKHLHIQPPDKLYPDVSFFEQGLTSLGATEIQYQLEQSCAIKLNSSTIFNFPTLDALLMHLMQHKLGSLFNVASDKSSSSEDVSVYDNQFAKQVLNDIFNL